MRWIIVLAHDNMAIMILYRNLRPEKKRAFERDETRQILRYLHIVAGSGWKCSQRIKLSGQETKIRKIGGLWVGNPCGWQTIHTYHIRIIHRVGYVYVLYKKKSRVTQTPRVRPTGDNNTTTGRYSRSPNTSGYFRRLVVVDGPLSHYVVVSWSPPPPPPPRSDLYPVTKTRVVGTYIIVIYERKRPFLGWRLILARARPGTLHRTGAGTVTYVVRARRYVTERKTSHYTI